MKIIPSPYVSDEFMVEITDARGRQILDAIGAARKHGIPHLTCARAEKADLLYRYGFEGVQRPNGRWWFRRNGCAPMRLSDAMRCIEAFK